MAALTTRTLYPVTAEPPSATGAVQPTSTSASPAVAITAVGAPGTVLAVTAALSNDAGEVPTTLVAVTVNVYAVPLTRPETVAVVAPVVLTVAPSGDAVTVYLVIRDPPVVVGAIHETRA